VIVRLADSGLYPRQGGQPRADHRAARGHRTRNHPRPHPHPSASRHHVKLKLDGPVHETWTLGYLADTIYLRDLWMHRIDAARAARPPADLTGAVSGGSAGLRPDERRPPKGVRMRRGRACERSWARLPRATDGEPPAVLGAPSGPGQWRVIEDDYLDAFVGSVSWCTACVHGGTVHGPGGSSGGGAASWGARVRARLSNRTPPAAAAASSAIAAE